MIPLHNNIDYSMTSTIVGGFYWLSMFRVLYIQISHSLFNPWLKTERSILVLSLGYSNLKRCHDFGSDFHSFLDWKKSSFLFWKLCLLQSKWVKGWQYISLWDDYEEQQGSNSLTLLDHFHVLSVQSCPLTC